MGTAGIVMTAIWAGGELGDELAERGAQALLSVAEQTPAGLDWRTWPGHSSPNFSHGTAGAGAALAVTGRALGRDDFIAAAVEGARHVISVAWTDGGRFVVPHTIPESSREVEPVTYTWCHGPAGTSMLFAALAHAGVSEVDGHDVAELRRRCLRTVLGAGVPQRLRPGFWDNDGRCCGTAGVGDVFLDAAQDALEPDLSEEWLQASVVMADALVERAVRDESGARWQFVEYRNTQPLLDPNTTWMQGAAGIGAFLFRVARVLDDGIGAAVVDRPDQWWAVPRGLRVSVQPLRDDGEQGAERLRAGLRQGT